MNEKINYRKIVIEAIKQKVTALNSVFLLITFIILFLVERYS